jgi:hypothetical protein
VPERFGTYPEEEPYPAADPEPLALKPDAIATPASAANALRRHRVAQAERLLAIGLREPEL